LRGAKLQRDRYRALASVSCARALPTRVPWIFVPHGHLPASIPGSSQRRPLGFIIALDPAMDGHLFVTSASPLSRLDVHPVRLARPLRLSGLDRDHAPAWKPAIVRA